MAQLSYREAVKAGIAQEMRLDDSVIFIGEDVAAAGGVFKTTEGLQAEFGELRVRDTPISEQAIIGAVAGAAMTGLKPIAEIMFSDFFAVCWDIVVNQIAKTRYMTDGQCSFPLVIRSANGGGARFGAQHSQSIENWAMAVPGLPPKTFVFSVLPGLAGWAIVGLFSGPSTFLAAFVLFIALFGWLYVYDRNAVRDGRAPDWYGALRGPLTGLVIVAFLISIAAVI